MDIEKLTVAGLFQLERRYLVPLFQRAYVWTVPDHCRPLWDDVLEEVEVVRRHRSNHEPRKHFLGAVVLAKATHSIGRSEAMEVIDGQQRLTTLQVLLAALRDVVKRADNVYVNDQLRSLTENPRFNIEESDRFKVWPTNVDRDHFRAVMTAGSKSALQQMYPPVYYRRKLQPSPPIVLAYSFFYDAITAFATADGFDTTAIDENATPVDPRLAEELFEVITRHLRLIGILLSAEDDPQVIFETLNARGAALEPSDLIRNYVFRSASRAGADVDKLYQTYWQHFDTEPNPGATRSQEQRFWKALEKQGRFRRSRLDLFVSHFLTYRTADEIRTTHLFQDFLGRQNQLT